MKGRRRPTTHRPRAVALRYEHEKDVAPSVVAKGEGEVAKKIIALAKEHGIPLHSDPDLVSVLAALDIESLIPPELYEVVAEILVFVYFLNEERNQAEAGLVTDSPEV